MAMILKTKAEVAAMEQLCKLRTAAARKRASVVPDKKTEEILSTLRENNFCDKTAVVALAETLSGKKLAKYLVDEKELKRSSYVLLKVTGKCSKGTYEGPYNEPLMSCGGARAYLVNGDVVNGNLPPDKYLAVCTTSDITKFFKDYSEIRGIK